MKMQVETVDCIFQMAQIILTLLDNLKQQQQRQHLVRLCNQRKLKLDYTLIILQGLVILKT